MDVRYLNPFVAAVQHVFKTMLHMDVLVGKPFLKEKNSPPPELSAAIVFVGGYTGTMQLCLSRQMADKIAARLTKRKASREPADMEDAIGELADMVAGQAKALAGIEGLEISISPPRVVSRTKPLRLKPSRIAALTLPCDCPLGRFAVEVSIVKAKTDPAVPASAVG